MILLWPLATAFPGLAGYAMERSSVGQVGEGAVEHPSATAGKINKKLRDGAGPACSDFGLDGDVGLLVGSPQGLAGQDDQIVVFDEDLAAEFDAGSSGTSEPLDKLRGGRQLHVEAASGGMQVADQVLESELAGCRGVPAPPGPGSAANAGGKPEVHRWIVAGHIPLLYTPARVPLEQGEQSYCLDVLVPAECEAVAAEGAVEDACLVQVSGEGGPLMNRR